MILAAQRRVNSSHNADPASERGRIPVIRDPPLRAVVLQDQRNLQAYREQRSGNRKTAMPLIESARSGSMRDFFAPLGQI